MPISVTIAVMLEKKGVVEVEVEVEAEVVVEVLLGLERLDTVT